MKKKSVGPDLTATEIYEAEEKRLKRAVRVKQYPPRRNLPQNYFPFSAVKPGRPNPMGLNLDRDDVRILRTLQTHGHIPGKLGEFCRVAKVPMKRLFERLIKNPDLVEAIRVLGFIPVAMSFPRNMEVLSEKPMVNAKFMELYLGILGMIDNPKMRLMKEQSEKPELLEQIDLERLLSL